MSSVPELGGDDMNRRRIMLMNGQEENEVKEWVDIYENTLNEDLDSIVINGLDCTEVEAYVINPNTRDTAKNIYLTTSANGNIYAEPRTYKSELKTQYIMRLSILKIKPYLFEKKAVCTNYLVGGNQVVDNIAYQNMVSSSVELNVEKINGITLMKESGSLEAGSKIYIRVR